MKHEMIDKLMIVDHCCAAVDIITSDKVLVVIYKFTRQKILYKKF